MRARTLPYGVQGNFVLVGPGTRSAPPRVLEYAYYGVVFHAILGSALGLSVEFLGVAILASLAVLCSLSLGLRASTVYAPVIFPLACAVSFVALQVLFHDESLLASYIRPFLTWGLTLIVVQSLVQRRQFFHRFALVAFLIALALLPYLKTGYMNSTRTGLDRAVGLANPNDLAAWFGFCALYFAVLGVETSRMVVRVASWLTTAGCLYVIGLTVSRGTLFSFAIATIVALRHSLKRSFLPLLSFCVLAWGLYISGIFTQAATSYAERGMVETGRLHVWPLALARFLEAPFTGVGVSNLATYVPTHHRSITPHNSFLFLGLAAGLIPLVFYGLYWWRAAWGAWRIQQSGTAEAAFCLPFLLYTLLVVLEGNLSFMKPWAVVVLAFALTASVPSQERGVIVRWRKRKAVV